MYERGIMRKIYAITLFQYPLEYPCGITIHFISTLLYNFHANNKSQMS